MNSEYFIKVLFGKSRCYRLLSLMVKEGGIYLKLINLLFISIIFTILLALSTGCSNKKTEEVSSASWAYSFVVWNGYIYKTSDEYVDKIDKGIGEVTMYSDKEGNYIGNFSNTYKRGTKYYSIKGISSDNAIAIREQDGRYTKAIRDGKYVGK